MWIPRGDTVVRGGAGRARHGLRASATVIWRVLATLLLMLAALAVDPAADGARSAHAQTGGQAQKLELLISGRGEGTPAEHGGDTWYRFFVRGADLNALTENQRALAIRTPLKIPFTYVGNNQFYVLIPQDRPASTFIIRLILPDGRATAAPLVHWADQPPSTTLPPTPDDGLRPEVHAVM